MTWIFLGGGLLTPPSWLTVALLALALAVRFLSVVDPDGIYFALEAEALAAAATFFLLYILYESKRESFKINYNLV